MPSPPLHTDDPIALRYLMTEAVFGIDEGVAAEEPAAEPVASAAAPSFHFFGGNKRNYLFLTHEEQHEWMPQVAMEAFIKTLAALKLSETDVALINLATLADPPSAEQLASFFNPVVVVNLGTPFAWPEQAGANVLNTHAFGDMLADAEKKRIFWTAIKQLLI